MKNYIIVYRLDNTDRYFYVGLAQDEKMARVQANNKLLKDKSLVSATIYFLSSAVTVEICRITNRPTEMLTPSGLPFSAFRQFLRNAERENKITSEVAYEKEEA